MNKSTINFLKQNQQSGHIFTIGDFLDCFNCYDFTDCNVHCLCQGEKIEYIPSLCFSWIENKFIFYKKMKYIKEALLNRNITSTKRSSRKNNYKILNGNRYFLIVENYDSFKIKEFRHFLSCCEILRDGSLNVRNHIRDNLNIVLDRVIKNIASVSNFNGYHLAKLISDTQEVKILYFSLLPNNQIKANANLNDTEKFLIKLLYNEYREFLFECRDNAKPISWKCNDLKKSYYYCIIPITIKYSDVRFATEFLLLWNDDHLSINSVNNIVDIVDTYASYGQLFRKFNPLVQLQRDAIENISNPFFRNKKDFYRRFSTFVRKCLNQIISTTYAHSCTVRLYDPFDKSLHLFEEVQSDWSVKNSTRTDGDYSRIKIKQYKSSLNAFTFLINSTKHSFSYIKNIRIKIPDEYFEKGLQQILKKRDSVSEICFPLFCGEIPFGTLNIESMLKDAFEHDKDYLIGIKQAVESFYEISHRSNDSIWLSGRSPVYRNVHELSQLLRLDKKIFTKEQADILQRLIMIDDKFVADRPILLNGIRTELIQWLSKNMNTLSLENLSKRLFFSFKNEIFVDLEVYEKIVVICKNILNNIIDHGNIKRDKFYIIEEDHLRMGVNAKIKIFVKTYGMFDEENFQNLLISPVIKEKEYHYGMFLIGVLARRLGGIALISQGKNGYSPHTIIELSLPLKATG